MAAILWLSRDFRFLDNAALRAASGQGPVLPVFLIDAGVRALGAAPRWRLARALEVFDAAWRARTGQGLTLLAGEAADLLPALAQEIGAADIHQNDWPHAPMRRAQAALRAALEGSNIRLRLHAGHLLIAPARIQSGKGSAYRVYTPFAKALRRIGAEPPVGPVAQIKALPSRGGLADLPPLAPDMHRGAAVLAAHALPAGEAAALERLDDFFAMAAAYPAGRDRPDQEVCSGLSEALALGEISPRLIWQRTALRIETSPTEAAGLDKFLSEVIWREFAWHLLIDFPDLAQESWRADWRDFPWRGDGPEVEAWRQARTGVPLVDAGLREMRVTGRMHNRVRMVVASWLTKHLLADWRLGEAFFADSLTDWDPASNAMNWQWVAGCGPDASPFFRIFNPAKQAADYDPEGRYRAAWLSPKGARGAAFYEAIPRDWPIPCPYVEDAGEDRLRGGRERALQALSDYRAIRQPD